MSMLNIGTSALLTSQGALNTTSNNISNINTEGFNRQRVEIKTNTPNFSGGNFVGAGAQITNIARFFDNFLASQLRTYTAQQAQQETFLTFSKQADDLLGSPEFGINSGMERFFNAVQEVANDPTSIAARQVLITEGQLLAGRFNAITGQFDEFSAQIDNSIRLGLDDINAIARNIASLNLAIITASSGGAQPNQLLDERDQLINRLSEYVSVSTVTADNGTISVFIGAGQALVSGGNAVSLLPITDNSTTPPRVNVAYGNATLDITAQLTGGRIGGALGARNEILDPTRETLDLLANALVEAFNDLHRDGVDLNGNAGENFFAQNTDPIANPVTAASIRVALTDPRKIAASSSTNPGLGNNENARALADLQLSSLTVSVAPGLTQSFSDVYAGLVSQVATRTNQSEVNQRTQQGLLNEVRRRYDSVSGVNLDEEATNLIRFQQSYQAASQIITVSNTVFNALLNAL